MQLFDLDIFTCFVNCDTIILYLNIFYSIHRLQRLSTVYLILQIDYTEFIRYILWGGIIKKHIKVFFLVTSILWFLLQAYTVAPQLKSVFMALSSTSIKYPIYISTNDILYVFVSSTAIILILFDVINKNFRYSKTVYAVLAALFLLRFIAQIFMFIKLVFSTISISQVILFTTILRHYTIFVVIALLDILVSIALLIFAMSKIFRIKKLSGFVMAFLVISIIGFVVLTLIGILQRDHIYLSHFVWDVLKNTLLLISIIGLNYIDNENQLLNSENEDDNEKIQLAKLSTEKQVKN